MKLLQWFKDFSVDKEERDNFYKLIKDKYIQYFDTASSHVSNYQLELQYNLFKTQQKIEELEKEIKQLKKGNKWK